MASATERSLSAASGSGSGGGAGPRRAAPIGPMLPPGIGPSSSAAQSESDAQFEHESRQHTLSLSRATRAPRESESDFASGSKEKMLANKANRRAADSEYRASREAGGMEDVREDVLMGAGDSDSFAARIRARDAARARGRGRGRGGVGRGDGGDGGAGDERRSAMRDKERETMDMFKAMARQRFGD